MKLVAGIGCRKGVSVEQVIAAVDKALMERQLGRGALHGLATVPKKADEPALAEAARSLRVPLIVAGDAGLEAARARLETRSEASLAATGFGSAAEAAAIAATAGRLLGPRTVLGPVACAIAEGSWQL